MRIVWLWLIGVGMMSGWSCDACARPQPKDCRIAILFAHNLSGGRAKRLRYAVSDAHKMKAVLQQVAGYTPSHIFLFANRSAAFIRKAFKHIDRRIKHMKRSGCKVTLLLYYSGHARNGQFYLGGSNLSFREVRTFLKRSQASLRLAFLDTCGSGRFLQMRGLVRERTTFRIPALNTHMAKGEAIITSTGTRENAYEDVKLKGGIFTHFMVTGLRGAADHNGDGTVTLNELYSYTYNWTLNRTVFARSGPQKPHFHTHLKGSGHVVLSTTQKINTQLHFTSNASGQFFIWNANQTLYAGFRKKAGSVLKLAIAPGMYTIQWRHRKRSFTTKVYLRQKRISRLRIQKRKLAIQQQWTARGQSSKTSTADWHVLRSLPNRDAWQLFIQAGGRGASLVRTAAWGGASIGLRHRFFAWRVGAWGASTQYQKRHTQHLYLTTRVDLGFHALWGHISLFAGGFLGGGLLVQDVTSSLRSGLIVQTGLTTVGSWYLSRYWSVGVAFDLGMDMGLFGGEWRAYPLWLGALELCYAF